MIQCPDCRNQIPDDSAFCDQCGKELHWCPECRRPKRGTECPVCGNDLIPGRKYLAGKAGPRVGAPDPVRDSSSRSTPDDGGDAPVSRVSSPEPAALVGNGWRLPLKEGPFGRSGGIWPALSSCPYVSGSHGRIEKDADGWMIVDADSTNGTFVDGSRIRKAYLRKGSRVRIATLDFIVE